MNSEKDIEAISVFMDIDNWRVEGLHGSEPVTHQMLQFLRWGWLMPVLIKMVSMPEYYKFRTSYSLYLEGNPLAIFSTTEIYDINVDIGFLYREITEFINWYNENNEN